MPVRLKVDDPLKEAVALWFADAVLDIMEFKAARSSRGGRNLVRSIIYVINVERRGQWDLIWDVKWKSQTAKLINILSCQNYFPFFIVFQFWK